MAAPALPPFEIPAVGTGVVAWFGMGTAVGFEESETVAVTVTELGLITDEVASGNEAASLASVVFVRIVVFAVILGLLNS